MERKVIKVKVEGGKKYGIIDDVYTWRTSIGDEESIFGGAINFAQGYATALMAQGFSLGYPLVMPLDGYHWTHGEFSIKVVNEKDEIVRTPKDI